MTKKTFHLRWNNHLQNLQNLFENLYNEQRLIDVTLSCSDGLLYGHKLVLSACSPYFDKVFKDNPCKHPIMILKGIKRHDMQVLLEYMYMGAVDVGEQDLEILLDIATELQIKGLVQLPDETHHGSSHQGTNQNKTRHSLKESFSVTPSSPATDLSDDLRWQAELVAKPSPSLSRLKEYDVPSKPIVDSRRNSLEETSTSLNQRMVQNEESEIEFEPIYQNQGVNDVSDDVTNDYQENSDEEFKDFTGLDNAEEGSEKNRDFNFIDCKTSDGDDTSFFCQTCNRGFQNKGSYHRHMLTHAGVKPHQCTFCNQSFLRLSHLQRHIRVHTGERPYSCGQCPKQFARSDKLRQHYIIQHHSVKANKVSRPRGRPRKNPGLPSPSSMNVSTLNSLYSKIIRLNLLKS